MSEQSALLEGRGEVPRAHWIERAEAALDGTEDPDIELLDPGRPPVLDAFGRRALLAPLLAGFFWSAAVFVEQLRGPLDSLGLLLRLLAFAVSVRSVLLCTALARRARVYMQHRRYRLALADEGLLLRTPHVDIPVEKADIVDIVGETVLAPKGRQGPIWADVYLVTRPHSGRTWVELPPVFARVPEALVEQLQAWRGEPEDGAPTSSASLEPSTTHIDWRRGLPRRGPYATILLGLVLLESYLRLPAPTRASVAGWVGVVIVTCTGLVPALWAVGARLRLGPRRGPLLSIAAGQLSVSTRSGPRRIAWTQVTKVETQLRTSWSLLHGTHIARALSIGQFDGRALRYGDDLVSVPVEVVCALCDAYRHGRIP